MYRRMCPAFPRLSCRLFHKYRLVLLLTPGPTDCQLCKLVLFTYFIATNSTVSHCKVRPEHIRTCPGCYSSPSSDAVEGIVTLCNPSSKLCWGGKNGEGHLQAFRFPRTNSPFFQHQSITYTHTHGVMVSCYSDAKTLPECFCRVAHMQGQGRGRWGLNVAAWITLPYTRHGPSLNSMRASEESLCFRLYGNSSWLCARDLTDMGGVRGFVSCANVLAAALKARRLCLISNLTIKFVMI